MNLLFAVVAVVAAHGVAVFVELTALGVFRVLLFAPVGAGYTGLAEV